MTFSQINRKTHLKVLCIRLNILKCKTNKWTMCQHTFWELFINKTKSINFVWISLTPLSLSLSLSHASMSLSHALIHRSVVVSQFGVGEWWYNDSALFLCSSETVPSFESNSSIPSNWWSVALIHWWCWGSFCETQIKERKPNPATQTKEKLAKDIEQKPLSLSGRNNRSQIHEISKWALRKQMGSKEPGKRAI